jgi:hypothetical protein
MPCSVNLLDRNSACSLPNTGLVRVHFALWIFAFCLLHLLMPERNFLTGQRDYIGAAKLVTILVRAYGAQSCLVWANFVDY